jgi:hypothetical protein
MRHILASLSLLAATSALAGEHTETYVVRPSGYIAATVANGSFVAPFPAGIATLDEPAIRDGLVLLARLEDTHGNVVGFASEQDVIDLASMVGHSTWTLTIPGRGTLFLTQDETLAPLFGFLTEMVAAGQLERTWDPPYVLTTTLPRTGLVVGGTGEFAHAHGRFREVDALHRISLLTGALEVTDTLVIDLHGDAR